MKKNTKYWFEQSNYKLFTMSDEFQWSVLVMDNVVETIVSSNVEFNLKNAVSPER